MAEVILDPPAPAEMAQLTLWSRDELYLLSTDHSVSSKVVNVLNH